MKDSGYTEPNYSKPKPYSTSHTDSLDFKPVEKGNIDPTNRPMVKLPSGETATVKTKSFEFGGLEVLVPTVRDDGYLMSDEEAIEHYRKTGKHFGKFRTVEEATKYAQALHLDQQAYYQQFYEG